MNTEKLEQAFDELEFDVTEKIHQDNYVEQQRQIAHGVTDRDDLLTRINMLDGLVTKLIARIIELESK